VNTSSNEYQKVKDLFMKTMKASAQITNIERVDNGSQHESFCGCILSSCSCSPSHCNTAFFQIVSSKFAFSFSSFSVFLRTDFCKHMLLALLALLLDASVCAAAAASAPSDPWTELGLQRGHATTRQVRAAYLHLARQLHPDKNRESEAKGAEKEERFKRVLQAYEEISGANGDTQPDSRSSCHADAAAPFAPGDRTARRAGSKPTKVTDNSPDCGRGSTRDSPSAGRFSSSDFDMRVFTDTVALQDMVQEPDEYVFECRCSGSFVLQMDAVIKHPTGRVAINCQLCSLWIWVMLDKS
jgi:hypothetical protein